MTSADERESLIRDFGVLLGAASRVERIAARAFERECGISHAMFEVLLRLDPGGDGSSMSELACDLILTSGGMTRLIDRMVKAGLVRRYPSTTDRRIQLADLTPRGQDMLAQAKRVHAETLKRFFAGPLSDGDREALVAALRQVDDRARKELGGLG
ncbi:MAG: putative MarR-family regulator [Actinomycetia bacterium]|nr:putative MarR-family regulator [Actinomycetes bacterium]